MFFLQLKLTYFIKLFFTILAKQPIAAFLPKNQLKLIKFFNTNASKNLDFSSNFIFDLL